MCSSDLVALAQAVGYHSAGTVELIVSGSETTGDSFYFLEMNTRLQVEHPVTEAITGVDLVEWQLRVASGEALPLRQEELAIAGHAVEARLYAEDPARGFLPSTGTLELLDLAEGQVRVETGVEQGDAVSPHYDPMIAKLVAHGETRAEAHRRLAGALADLRVWPVRTNAAFLLACLSDPVVQTGQATTALIADRGTELTETGDPGDNEWQVAALALFAPWYARTETPLAGPWDKALGLRLAAPEQTRITIQHAEERRTLMLADCVYASGEAAQVGDGVLAMRQGQPYLFTMPRFASGPQAAGDGAILAPMPGKVIAVEVAAGQQVSAGQRLLVLEAMKMEHALLAPMDGVVAELNVAAGSQVQVDALLARVEASTPAEPDRAPAAR